MWMREILNAEYECNYCNYSIALRELRQFTLHAISISGDINTKICGVASLECCKTAERTLSVIEKSFRDTCNCLPSCTYIEYNANIDRMKFDYDLLEEKMDSKLHPGAR